MSGRVLLIEDDPRLAEMVKSYLGEAGFDVMIAAKGGSGVMAEKRESFDALILDLMLPDMDGLEVCRRIRASSDTPILMLTARGDTMDRVVGLELGADDYLPKPFEPRELVARMQAVLRRGAHEDEDIARVGPLELNWMTRSASLKGRALPLTTAEFELLGLLVRNRGRVLTRDRIMEAMRGVDAEAYDRSIDVLVSRVRQKLGDDAKRSIFIRTVRGIGYSFTGNDRD
jgi:DNA-binding response OmpR family regulator